MNRFAPTAPAPVRRPRWSTLFALAVVVGGAVGVVALAGAVPAHARTHTATQQVVLRPVTASGRAAKGYRVVPDTRPAIECVSPARSAVGAGIATCGSSADNALACWASATRGRVLCLTDPFARTLRSIGLSGAFPAVRAPHHASPQALQLADGDRYLMRSGGAAGRLQSHPNWVAFYYQRGTFARSVYGPRASDGVNRRHEKWFVTTFRHETGPGARHDVARAYYVGTAA